MRKSSKIISLALTATMATSCFTGLSICSASAAEGETKVYFEVPTLESWGTTKSVFCHMYNVYGGSPLIETSWGSRAETCKKDAATGRYYFDTSTLGTIEEGADYALLFSTKDTAGGKHQTGNITFGADCLGDTVYLTGEMVENTEDSSKMDFEGAWKNNSDKYGAKRVITSTGKIVGKYLPVYQPKEQLVAQYIASWAVKNASLTEGAVTAEKLANICTELGVQPADVLAQYKADYATQLADPENNPLIADVETVAGLLGVDPYPTTEPTEPATTEPATTEPVTTEPVTTEPVTTEPVTTEPATTEPATTEPVTTEPVTTEPATTEPATTEPATTEPVTTEPATTEPATTEPVTTEPVTDPTEPVTTEPATTEPVTTEPVTTEPVTDPTEPVTTEPVTTEPATTEPATDPTDPTDPEPTEPALIYGDVDMDGEVTIKDATLVQKISVGLVKSISQEALALADVDGDGRISIVDATYIQKYCVGGFKKTAMVGKKYEILEAV